MGPIIQNKGHLGSRYLDLVDFYGFHVGRYTSPMDPMGRDDCIFT